VRNYRVGVDHPSARRPNSRPYSSVKGQAGKSLTKRCREVRAGRAQVHGCRGLAPRERDRCSERATVLGYDACGTGRSTRQSLPCAKASIRSTAGYATSTKRSGEPSPEPFPPRIFANANASALDGLSREEINKLVAARGKVVSALNARMRRRNRLMALAGRSIRYLRLEDRLGRPPTRKEFERLGTARMVLHDAAAISGLQPDEMWARFSGAVDREATTGVRPDSTTVRLALIGLAVQSSRPGPVALTVVRDRRPRSREIALWSAGQDDPDP
jgi:hypothetical protein